MADGGVEAHVVTRELIALSEAGAPPVLGMFMGGAGLADAMLVLPKLSLYRWVCPTASVTSWPPSHHSSRS